MATELFALSIGVMYKRYFGEIVVFEFAGPSRMRIPVYLSCHQMRDASGTMISIRERRLVRRTPSDRVIAMIEAPAGTRVRRKMDQHGHEQLIVPIRPSFWARVWGDVVVIPAKYVIGNAKCGAYGLSLVDLTCTEQVAT